MVLHHVCTIMLYFASYMLGLIKVGFLISFLHDLADVPASFMKMLIETTFERSKVAVFMFIISLWGYSRIYVFPIVIFRGAGGGPNFMFPNADLEGHPDFLKRICAEKSIHPCIVLLTFLLILNIYWFFMFWISLYKAMTEGGDIAKSNNRLTSAFSAINDKEKLCDIKVDMMGNGQEQKLYMPKDD
jgi:hypothetical protein